MAVELKDEMRLEAKRMNQQWGNLANKMGTMVEDLVHPKIIGILATSHVDDSVLAYAEKKGLLVLAVGEKLMEVKNRKRFKPKEY